MLESVLMSEAHDKVPVVMVFAGLDPTGGAGLQADIEAIASMGCHAAPVVTAIAVQDTWDVKSCTPLEPTQIIEQARAVLDDVPVAAFKVGLMGSIDYRNIPLIVDPVLTSGGGTPIAEEETLDAMVSLLFPETTVLTPNSMEARVLAPEADTLDAVAQELMSYGCRFVLITGGHEPTPEVINRLYTDRRRVEASTWRRLPGTYHGSGCTLASAIAALLAQGGETRSAIQQAQRYTWEALRHGYAIGQGQSLPNRFYWSRQPRDESV